MMYSVYKRGFGGRLRRAIVVLGFIPVLLLITGCSDDNPVDHGRNTIQVQRNDLLIPNATSPVWIPGSDAIVFSYRGTENMPGIYRADVTSGDIEPVWTNPGFHNYDYTVSPDGEYIAFSTSEILGGVYVQHFGEQAELILPNAYTPAWFPDSEHLVCKDGTGRILKMTHLGGDVEVLSPAGQAPSVSPDGSKLAYLQPYFTGAFRLYIREIDNPGVEIQTGATLLGSEYVWGFPNTTIYAVWHGPEETLSAIQTIDLSAPGAPEYLTLDATNPSIGNQGSYLLFTSLEEDRSLGISIYLFDRDLETELWFSDETLFYGAIADPQGDRAAVETDNGIHILEW